MPTRRRRQRTDRHRGCGGAERVERHLRSAPRDLANAGRSIGVPARVDHVLGAEFAGAIQRRLGDIDRNNVGAERRSIITADKPTPPHP